MNENFCVTSQFGNFPLAYQGTCYFANGLQQKIGIEVKGHPVLDGLI